MLSLKYRRPDDLPRPRVWSRFQKKRGDQTVHFRIQDITDEMHGDVFEFVRRHLVSEEIWRVATGFSVDQEALRITEVYLHKVILPQKISLVCLVEGTDEIVSYNLVGVSSREEPEDFSDMMVSKPIVDILRLYALLKSHCPCVYEKYGVDSYLNSMGLCVRPDYRGLGIATEMLLARIPLCRALGLKVCSNVFTSMAAQRAASRAGFQTEGSVTYELLAKETGIVFKTDAVETKHMTLVISESE